MGVHITRTTIFGGSILGSLYFGKLPYKVGSRAHAPTVSTLESVAFRVWEGLAKC